MKYQFIFNIIDSSTQLENDGKKGFHVASLKV